MLHLQTIMNFEQEQKVHVTGCMKVANMVHDTKEEWITWGWMSKESDIYKQCKIYNNYILY